MESESSFPITRLHHNMNFRTCLVIGDDVIHFKDSINQIRVAFITTHCCNRKLSIRVRGERGRRRLDSVRSHDYLVIDGGV